MFSRGHGAWGGSAFMIKFFDQKIRTFDGIFKPLKQDLFLFLAGKLPSGIRFTKPVKKFIKYYRS